MRRSVSLYHRHRFPAEIISHCIWLYYRFSLSFRDVEEMLAMRGVNLSYDLLCWKSNCDAGRRTAVVAVALNYGRGVEAVAETVDEWNGRSIGVGFDPPNWK
jgi:hypothetical protein